MYKFENNFGNYLNIFFKGFVFVIFKMFIFEKKIFVKLKFYFLNKYIYVFLLFLFFDVNE